MHEFDAARDAVDRAFFLLRIRFEQATQHLRPDHLALLATSLLEVADRGRFGLHHLIELVLVRVDRAVYLDSLHKGMKGVTYFWQ